MISPDIRQLRTIGDQLLELETKTEELDRRGKDILSQVFMPEVLLFLNGEITRDELSKRLHSLSGDEPLTLKYDTNIYWQDGTQAPAMTVILTTCGVTIVEWYNTKAKRWGLDD